MDLFKNPIFGKSEALEQRLRRICTNCGQQIEHAAKKCVHCGHIPQEVKVQAARVCPNGHTMDPTWTHCPYCQDSGAPRNANEGAGPSRNRTRVQEDAADSGSERKTRNYDQPQEPAVAEYHGRIVGVLISYSRRREGEVFAIREGKNFIGSGNCVSTGLPCDVWFPEDKAMSSEHALILFRLGEFLIFDQQSTNGTFL
ncbi:MAG TPA: FHA domain-containing protein, partial [Bryobacteraceae bacterium]|nr:FHA domain-containing protein [Bryobacteraceae bacterium]